MGDDQDRTDAPEDAPEGDVEAEDAPGVGALDEADERDPPEPNEPA